MKFANLKTIFYYKKLYTFFLHKSYLSIEWKSIKPHRTDKVNMSGLGVHDLLVTGDPQTSMLRQHFNYLNFKCGVCGKTKQK